MEITDNLIVVLTPRGGPPILCIPHGFGGLHRARDLPKFQARVESAEPGERCLIHLVWHAVGTVAAHVDLEGCEVRAATTEEVALFVDRCWAHRRSPDAERGAFAEGGLLSLDAAIQLIDELPVQKRHIHPET